MHTLKILFYGLVLFSFGISCSRPPTDPKTVSIPGAEAAQQANALRDSVSVQLADGFQLRLWASEKLLADPIGLDITNKGVAYVSVTNRRSSSKPDIRSHPDWTEASISWSSVDERTDFLEKMLAPERSRQNSSWLQDLNNDGSHDWKDLTVNREEIFKIMDRSGDGIADFSQRYLHDFHQKETDVAGTVLYHNQDVFVGVAPDLWRTRDTNGDGLADSKTAISSGYAVHIGFRGHGMSGLTMGPDGRLYWSIGDVGLNVTGPDGKRWVYPNQGAILRAEPDGSHFEVFAAGLRNPHEFAFDKYGNLITADHDGDHAGEQERLVYVINGSDSGWRTNWQFGKYTDPKNNAYKVWMDEGYHKPRFQEQAAHILPPLASYHNGAAGMAYNPGTALGPEWQNHFFVSDFTGSATTSAIHAFELKSKGASFTLAEDQTIVKGVLPTGLDFGPDGSLYFTDWIEGWDTNDKGRIWKLDTPAEVSASVRQETQTILSSDFTSFSTERLSQFLAHPDMRVRMEAQFELVRREEMQTLLSAIGQTDHRLARLHGIWGIGQLARDNLDEARKLLPYLEASDAEIRAQVAKTLGDVRYKPAAEELIPLLEDPSLRVRLFATQALGRIKYRPAVQPIVAMLATNNGRDVYLRHGGAIALARIGDVQALAGLAEHPSEAVRIAAVVALKRLESPVVARFLHDSSEYVVTNAARAINDDTFIEEALPELARMLDQPEFTNEPLLRRAINASLFSGTAADARRLAQFALNPSISNTLRAEALATLSVWPAPSPLDRVTGRYRGQIHHPKEDAVQAVKPIIEPLLAEGNAQVTTALLTTIQALEITSARDPLFTLLRHSSQPDVQTAALNTLHELDFPDINQALEVALQSEAPELRMAALGLIPSLHLPSPQKVKLLASVLDENRTVNEQQKALHVLGVMKSEQTEKVLLRQLKKLVDGTLAKALQLDVLQAADSSGSEQLQTMLAEYQKAKPEDDLLAQYREALYGGNARKGEHLFFNHSAAQCIRCHAIGGKGGSVGPGLASIGQKLSRRQLLESMIAPNSRIAPGFGSVAVTTRGGRQITGVLANETADSLTLRQPDGGSLTLAKSNITRRQNSPSAMFSMTQILTKSQLRDLVEFLSRQTGNQKP